MKRQMHAGWRGKVRSPGAALILQPAGFSSRAFSRIAWCLGVLVVLCLLSTPVKALDQAMPEGHPPIDGSGAAAPAAMDAAAQKTYDELNSQDRTDFIKNIDLADLRTLAIDHDDQMKILDSWAREVLYTISRSSHLDGHDALYTALDMMWRPEVYYNRNILYVQAVPLRMKLSMLAQGVNDAARQLEQQRMLKEATISPAFYDRKDVQQLLQTEQETNALMAPQVTKVRVAYFTFMRLEETFHILPATNSPTTEWVHPMAVLANFADGQAAIAKNGAPVVARAVYSAAASQKLATAMMNLHDGWRNNDVLVANAAIKDLSGQLPTMAPLAYPSKTKRVVELWYNRTFNGTVIGAIYALAWILFTISVFAELPSLWKPAIVLFAFAVICHIAAMGVRWWLAGRIPIQNEFESVLASALIGCVLGLLLELFYKRRGIFGMAFSFVGFLAMIACFASPYVFGRDIGNSIGRVAGVLNNYWLYIHVNIVIWSYALIAASFVIGSVYWLSRLWHWIAPAQGVEVAPELAGARADAAAAVERGTGDVEFAYLTAHRRTMLDGLDAANVVILQLAFWLLGAGIICGAIWADSSWGRPWGWDPKETFALVTWIVYLIILHVRVAAPRNKAPLTATLAIIGFGVMMFNWIGVNFFLVGLHSYA